MEEFVYQVESLTNATLGGDFTLLVDNLHTLFSKQLSPWYWDLHRRSPNRSWEHYKQALLSEWSDHLDDEDIRDRMSARRQKPDEKFTEYHHALRRIRNQLRTDISDREFLGIVRRGLLPVYQMKMSILEARTIRELQERVTKFETAKLRLKTLLPRHRVEEAHGGYEISSSMQDTYLLPAEHGQGLEAVAVKTGTVCWNCDRPGHFYTDCLVPSQGVFCFGCGQKGVYKPQCPACSTKNPRRVESNNSSSRQGPSRSQQADSTSTAPTLTRN